jgi:serine/threonine protein kinase
MIYPTLSKYSSAVSNPKTAFTKQDGTALDSELSLGKPVIYQTGMGAMPLYFPGGYACVFKYENNLQNKFWAVRCFLQANPSVASHYAKVSQRLKTIPCKQYFIDFQFQEEGIRIVDNNQIYPIVKMEWAEGDDLRTFITNNLGNKNKLSELADIWVTLSRDLKKAGIAHGDIQHGNILIEDASTLKLKLVDYDSLYFTSDGNAINNEIHGYPEYQHPLRSSLAKQCLQMDFFPQLVVYLSLKALIADSKIWQKYKLSNADRRLLFEPADFADPDNSKICQHLLTLSRNTKTNP